MSLFDPIQQKMSRAKEHDISILSFNRNYDFLCSGQEGLIPEEEIKALESLSSYEELSPQEWDQNLLNQSVIIKLNGGLGTGMGLTKAKSLLPVKEGNTFLDLIIKQVLHLRKQTHSQVRCLFMNSFSTSADTLHHLSQYQEKGLEDPSKLEFIQSQVPKIDVQSLEAIEYPQNPALEWCPPGHGDIFTALSGSGCLDQLLEEGISYAFISNSDNLGATLCPRLLHYFATQNIPFLMEVTRRTEADKKGGHLTQNHQTGQLLLREIAQCPEKDLPEFQNIEKHKYFNTNNLWVNLKALKTALYDAKGVLPLPVIKNKKTVDPRDSSSPLVWQLETAMGSAIQCFPEALAIEIPRSRFAPVKSTSDLLALRSDAYELRADFSIGLIPSRQGVPPNISLSADYKLLDALDLLGPVPSMKKLDSLSINGLFTFSQGVALNGDVSFENTASTPQIISIDSSQHG